MLLPRLPFGLGLMASVVTLANAEASLPMIPLPPPAGQTCPETCDISGVDSSNWTVVARFDQLVACPRPILLDFSLDVPTTDTQFIRSCDAWGESYIYKSAPEIAATSVNNTESLIPHLAWSPSASATERVGVRASTILQELQDHLQYAPSWEKTILFGSFEGATVGVFIGRDILTADAANILFSPLADKIREVGIGRSKSALLQVCGEGRSVSRTIGVIAAADSDLTTVQSAVKSWANATCVDTSSFTNSEDIKPVSVQAQLTDSSFSGWNFTANSTTAVTHRGLHSKLFSHPISPRANCRTIQVEPKNGCAELATRCGISGSDFTKFNPDSKLCSTLKPGQHVCCSAGTRPDFKPKPKADGYCFDYKTKTGDNCYDLAAANDLQVKDLEDFNKQTWGWAGCDRLWADLKMCLSTGTPPMPAYIANAVCGPQKLDTSIPPKGTNISMLNPCPLSACCNIWGQCGTTADFCIDTRGNGAPGTAKEGTYGCISNCGMDVVKSAAPAQFMKLGYFEAFNLKRDCLNMDVSQIDPSFTHIHFAFGMLTDNFEVYLEDAYAKYQFEQFKKLKGPKRILSFGGWTFSAERPYYTILREGVKPANMDKLATNIAKFVNDAGLDGVDIDWEYPGAPDIPGIPKSDNPNEAMHYGVFLALLKSKLKPGMTISMAAPASYWYLKQFPLRGIAPTLDYIVYMTYDLHGQWDAGNKWASPGCPTGNCLRSHVNITETINALSMITKAGVPSNKVIVGIASYGRSFQMADPKCSGPDCLFTGTSGPGGSNAKKGRCTGTAGYISNAEIRDILLTGGPGVSSRYDTASRSDILTYGGDNWVAFMGDTERDDRARVYKGLNMGGTTDWAVDLERFHDPPKPSKGGENIKLSWLQIKQNILLGGDVTSCNPELRTGNWVSHECTESAVTNYTRTSPRVIWEQLECPSAWNDAKIRWEFCDQPEDIPFSESMSSFLHSRQNPKCDDVLMVDNCNPDDKCVATHSPADLKRDWTGACAFLVWNSLASVHVLIKNFAYSLEVAGHRIQNKKQEFLSTFAPQGHKPDYALGINILLTILQIPATTLGTAFWKGGMKNLDFFTDKSLSLDLAKDTSQAMVMAGFNIARNFVDKETAKEVSFNFIYDNIIEKWKAQQVELTSSLFNGSVESIRTLDSLIGIGQMVRGKREGGSRPADALNYTEEFMNEYITERTFYAAAIPSVWKMRQPYAQYPVILDFGPDCNRDIGSGNFFHGGEDFNEGWICLDNHNYILASTYDRDNDGPNCSPEYWEWCNNPNPDWKLLFTLPGLDKIKERKKQFGNVTVEDLVAGSVATWLRAGKLNLIDDKTPLINPLNRNDFNDLWDNDIRAPGNIRIPVCNPKEATVLATDGLGHGIPDGDRASFPCLRDPSKRYDSPWVTWPS